MLNQKLIILGVILLLAIALGGYFVSTQNIFDIQKPVIREKPAGSEVGTIYGRGGADYCNKRRI
ncbi:MAG: hypothetical protein COU90_04770 [Candidatus Ryanbacteria bacterium CG10_big_fil_rev_8_21_14_0_10_43_42]|uniref:Uncharacterized protein n=1 Tax=Candidatus Ryanbacteria bacterium CG10_big_fil_rev_8_21_14_0_10_43_42 TaxID=1974864 RepID=A0A2M8KW44_9BACT|nr:MAG: hypothetical protein COU90_04770 [Candidatus Ryanbacteria bacterium CG10_big_fil_rev_8_21_14_0_10_43_42]